LLSNRLAEGSGWDEKLLALEFQDLLEIDLTLDLSFDLSITGFAQAEIDQLVESARGTDEAADDALPEEEPSPPVSQLGDVWLLDEHRIICADATDPTTYERLMQGERATLSMSDPPYNVPIEGHVSTSRRHGEFVMASGEMSQPQFLHFLTGFLTCTTAAVSPGAIQFVFMDWRHIGELLAAGEATGLELKNLCVWNKGSGAMGSFYRSQHELVFVFKAPGGAHINNVLLGKYGRNRTNVWDHPGAPSLREELALHATPKPVALIAEAIRDGSHRGDLVLDGFSGSGTTIIAAAKTGRRARVVELDPKFVDVAVRRWQDWSGGTAYHAEMGLSFAEMAERRSQNPAVHGTSSSHSPETSPEPSPVRVRRRTLVA
jgi:DNA modification methylase